MYKAKKEIVRKYYKYGTTINGVVVGSPTITDGIASGFSGSNFIKKPQLFDISNANSWELNTKITTGSNVTANQIVFGSGWGSSSGSCGAYLQVYSGKIRFIVPLATSVTTAIVLEYSITANTTYTLKGEFTGSEYNLYVDNVLVATQSDTRKGLYNATYNIDVRVGNSSASSIYFQGSVDLTKTYIRMNGKNWWHTTYEEETTQEQAEWYRDVGVYKSYKANNTYKALRS